jgi:hypothetical protein
LKGFLNKGETSSLIGPPGSGKSALQTEIAVHVASGNDWRGHKARDEQHGVLILALERGDLYRRRLHAYGIRDRLTELPIAVADAVIDLLDEGSVERIVSTVRIAEYHFGCKVGLVIIDTYAKGIAAGGGDEDKAKDQNRAANHLRMIHARLEAAVHIALVGHTGKDESRGARGSNAHVGDVDLMVQISGDKTKKAEVIKANDQPERTIAEFTLDQFTIGEDEDGDPLTTTIVSAERSAQGLSNHVSPKSTKFLAALTSAIMKDDARVIDGKPAATIDSWKRECIDAGLIDPEKANSARTLFNKHRSELRKAHRIGFRDNWAWIEE